MEKDVTFVILGATGDLTKLKLIPAIYNLVKLNKVDKFSIIGTARSNISINDILMGAKQSIKNIDENVWEKIVRFSYYTQTDFSKGAEYMNLKSFIENVEKQNGLTGKRLMYLATLPEHFHSITHNLAKSDIVNKSKDWARVLYEKPFGTDLKSAKKINSCINEAFDEKHIYRVDHYLGKELVGNIALLRFTNRILEPLWNKNHIENIQIIIDENFGIKNRGKFYDKYGAIKDVLQNHALQILALIAMESPKMLTGDHIRDKKVDVLKRTRVEDIIIGQYEGYKNEPGVEKDSKTETFFKAKLSIKNKRWEGVPFFISGGKNLAKKQAIIKIKFKPVDSLLTSGSKYDDNYLTIRIQPDEGFTFDINSKSVGKGFEVQKAKMDFSHANLFGPNTPESYEVLLEEAINGEHSLFVRNDEIEYQWKIVDKIQKGEIYNYEIGSKGPKEMDSWEIKNKLII